MDREPDAVGMDGGLLAFLRNEGFDCTEPQSVRVCDISPLPQLKNNTSGENEEQRQLKSLQALRIDQLYLRKNC